MKQKLDLETTSSDKSGLNGLFERLLRKFKVVTQLATMLPLYVFASFVFALGLTPGVLIFRVMSEWANETHFLFQSFIYAFSIAFGYFMYGVTMIFVVPLMNKLLVGRLQEWRGNYYSSESLKWFIHNGLTYLVRFTFLEFVTPSPIAQLFYEMMGMKIGKGVVINSTWISDPSLIEIQDKTTIGGSVTIVAHYGQGGLLVIAPVKIGSNCTIGIKATIMGGCEIGDGAKILPHSVLLPKTVVPAGEIWAGVPAQKIELKKVVQT